MNSDSIAVNRTFLFIVVVFGLVFLDNEVVDDEVLTFHRVLAHIVFQKLLHLVVLMQGDLFQSHVRTYEARKLLRRDFTKTFESGNLWIGTQLLNSLQALFITITVTGDEVALLAILTHLLVLDLRTLITDTEQRSLEYIDVTLLDEFGEELQEEGDSGGV